MSIVIGSEIKVSVNEQNNSINVSINNDNNNSVSVKAGKILNVSINPTSRTLFSSIEEEKIIKANISNMVGIAECPPVIDGGRLI